MCAVARTYDTAENRWAGVGPYYAMFPTDFADAVIAQYSRPGDTVLDPFAGRATAIYSSAIRERVGIGIEVNPVGWVYGKAKLNPAKPEAVLDRIRLLAAKSTQYRSRALDLPEFFQRCFSLNVRAFLLSARANLAWRNNSVDWTLMAFMLIYLHGKLGQALSNQMRQTKSMSPPYAIDWWKTRDMQPPELNPVEFLENRVLWRYAKGRPKVTRSYIFLGDCLQKLPRLRKELKVLPARLLFTSPPYCGVTNYYYDQWLRLWLLGYPPHAHNVTGKNKGRFCAHEAYVDLLRQAFVRSAELLAADAVVYVRTDSRNFTLEVTKQVLKEVFPNKELSAIHRPFSQPTQTHLFGDKSRKNGEIDLVLMPKN